MDFRIVAGLLFAAAVPLAAADANTAAPVALKSVKPEYPKELHDIGYSGKVHVEFIVGANGDVADAWVVTSPDYRFSAAAIAAVKQWKFKPGMKDGKPVNTHMVVDVAFNVDLKELAALAAAAGKSGVRVISNPVPPDFSSKSPLQRMDELARQVAREEAMRAAQNLRK